MPASLLALAEQYLEGRCVSPDYARHVLAVARQCHTLAVPAVNSYIRKRLTEIAEVTVATDRAIIVGIWKWAYETGVVDALPRGIVKVKVRRRPTKAWTLEQCCTAVKGTFRLRGEVRNKGVELGLFMRCWMLLGYETGARHGDLWAMRGSDFEDTTVRWSQHKTGEPIVKALTPACMDAVRSMLAKSPDGRVLGWVMRATSAQRRMRQYLPSVGLKGSSKWLRRSGATHIEMAHPGKGRLHLGHRTVGLAERAYIDWSQVRRDIPMTPVLLE